MPAESLGFIFLNALVINNFVLAMFLGICPFLGVSGKTETAARMGAGTTQVKILNRGSILGGLWVWPQRKKLIHIVTPVKNI